jgi:hypothetical protein
MSAKICYADVVSYEKFSTIGANRRGSAHEQKGSQAMFNWCLTSIEDLPAYGRQSLAHKQRAWCDELDVFGRLEPGAVGTLRTHSILFCSRTTRAMIRWVFGSNFIDGQDRQVATWSELRYSYYSQFRGDQGSNTGVEVIWLGRVSLVRRSPCTISVERSSRILHGKFMTGVLRHVRQWR